MNNILELIPQRAPIVMVDEFLGIEDNISRTRFTVYNDNIFVDDNKFSECGLIEHIAQSAAARVGYIFKSKNMPIPIGYIGSVNDFVITETLKPGDTITTTIEILQEVFSITLIKATCSVDDKEIASCKMKIFLEQ
ncbi:MAG: hydroxymyristoyl-ACP dehydratase [Bacteroidales bacterium]|nr:hydroxymyristoyl-ACP dehydratase [Bacteroidales bacterium]